MTKTKSSTADITVGKPIIVILKFALPVLILSLLGNLYSIADGKIASELVSISAFTAIGSTGIIVQTFYAITENFANGFTMQIAKKFGAGDEEGVKEATALIMILFAIVVFFVTVAMFSSVKILLSLLETPHAYRKLALPYLNIIFIGVPFNSFQALFSFMMRAVGNSKIGLYIYAISTVMNVVLSLLFVGFFNWGIQGAAIGTVVCQIFSCITTYIVLKSKFKIFNFKKIHINFQVQRVLQTLSLGASMAVMMLLVNIGGLVLQYAINGLSETTIIAHIAARKIDYILMLPITAVTSSIAVFFAQNLGAKNYNRIDVGLRDTLILSVGLNVIIVLITLLFGKSLVAWTCGYKDAEMLSIAYKYLIFNVSNFLFLATLFVYKSGLIAMNRGVGTLVIGIVEFAIKVYISLVLIKTMGYSAIIISEPVSWLIMTLIEMVFYYSYYKKFKNGIVTIS